MKENEQYKARLTIWNITWQEDCQEMIHVPDRFIFEFDNDIHKNCYQQYVESFIELIEKNDVNNVLSYKWKLEENGLRTHKIKVCKPRKVILNDEIMKEMLSKVES